jgi:hypothetical protein
VIGSVPVIKLIPALIEPTTGTKSVRVDRIVSNEETDSLRDQARHLFNLVPHSGRTSHTTANIVSFSVFATGKYRSRPLLPRCAVPLSKK